MIDFERVFQNFEGEIDLVNGKTVERFLCVMVRNDETNELKPCVFWLKMFKEKQWHRFYIDDFCACWDIYSELDKGDLDYEDDVFPIHDIGEQLGLNGKEIKHVDCDVDQEHTITLRIVFSSDEEFRTRTTLDYDSDMELVRT